MTAAIKTAVIAALIGVVATVAAYFYGRSDGRDLERKAALESAMEQVAEVREEDRRRLKAQEGIANEAKQKLDGALADAAAHRAVSDRLRNSVASLTARINHTAATGDCTATGTAGLLFADLFSRCEARLGDLGAYADRARIAGEACEASYDAARGKNNE